MLVNRFIFTVYLLLFNAKQTVFIKGITVITCKFLWLLSVLLASIFTSHIISGTCFTPFSCNSILERFIGGITRELCAQESINDPAIHTILSTACDAFQMDVSTIHLCWTHDIILLNSFSDFVWGNTIFLDKSSWYNLSPYLQKWCIWHNVAHIKRRDYALEQIKFSATYGSCAYLLKHYVPLAKKLKSAIVMFGLPYLYVTFIRRIEFEANILTAQILCKKNEKDIVKAMYHHYKNYQNTFSPTARPAPFFPTFKELALSLYNVLDEYDLLERLSQKEPVT